MLRPVGYRSLAWGALIAGVVMQAIRRKSEQWKATFFGLLLISTLWVIWNDERFLVIPNHPNWQHIAPFKWLLLVHGVFGPTALLLGASQFSSRLRRRPSVHGWLGRGYVGAVVIASLFASYFGPRYEPVSIHIEQYFQALGWLTATLVGWWHIRRRNLAAHRLWMMRSYGFTLIFISSRVPDGMPGFAWNDQLLSDVLWGLIVAAIVVPDFIVMMIGAAKWPPELLPARKDGEAKPLPPPPR